MNEDKTSNGPPGSLISKVAKGRGRCVPGRISLGTAVLPQNLISTAFSQTLQAGSILQPLTQNFIAVNPLAPGSETKGRTLR